MPRRPDAEELAQRLPPCAPAQAADLRDVDANEVDQALGDERDVLVLRVEQLSHRQRDGRLLPQQTEVVVLFGREWILEEEQPILFELLAERDGLVSVTRSWTSCSSSTSSPIVLRRCSNSLGTMRT